MTSRGDEETYLDSLPARALPFSLPQLLNRWLDKNLGIMISASAHKPSQ